VILVPPALVAAIKNVTTDYANATGQTEEECQRLVELGVLTRGIEAMRRQVEIERATARKAGWASCGAWRIGAVPVGIDQQQQICGRRVDFTFFTEDHRAMVAIELDGHEFHERSKAQASKDKSNDRKIQEAGWLVLRFTGSEIWRDPFACVDEVARIVRSKL
jgi:very-short-patch-repair endonuclease